MSKSYDIYRTLDNPRGDKGTLVLLESVDTLHEAKRRVRGMKGEWLVVLTVSEVVISSGEAE